MKNNTVNAKSHKRGLLNIIRSVVGASILTVVMSASASHDGDTTQMECESLLTQQGMVVYMTNSGLLAEDGSGPKEGLSNEQAQEVQYITETYLDANPACLDMSAVAWVDYAAGMNQEEADSDDAETAAPIPADADAGEAPVPVPEELGLDPAQQEIEALRAELESVRADRDLLEGDFRNVEEKRNQIERDLHETRGQRDHAEDESTHLRTERDNMVSDFESVMRERDGIVNDLVNALNGAENELNNLHQDRNNLEAELQAFIAEREDLFTQFNVYQAQVDSEINQCNETVNLLSQDLNQCSAEKDEAMSMAEAPEMFDACTEQHGPEGQQFCNDPAFCGEAEFCGSCAYNAENDHCYTEDFASEVAHDEPDFERRGSGPRNPVQGSR